MASHAYSTTASAADSFYPTLLRTRRRALEDWIERAIALLDRFDGDADAEDAGSAETSVQPLAMRGGEDVIAA